MPSVGYKVYEVRSGAATAFPNAATTNGNTIENDFYRLTLAGDGAITSLIDKQRGNRETVRTINGRVLNDFGGNRSGRVVVENAGAASVTLRAESTNPLEHTTRVTFYRNSNRIDIDNQITTEFRRCQNVEFLVRHQFAGRLARRSRRGDSRQTDDERRTLFTRKTRVTIG